MINGSAMTTRTTYKMLRVAVVITISAICFYMIALLRQQQRQQQPPPPQQQQQAPIVAKFQLKVTPTPSDALREKLRPNRNQVLLMTYLRSGSSLTGDILQASADVFYVFEPLHTLNELWEDSKAPLMFFEKKHLRYSSSHYRLAAVRTVESILNCSFSSVDLATLKQFHMKRSRTTLPFRECVKRSSGVLGIRSCLQLIEDACTTRRTTVQKVVRLSLKNITPFMKKYPDLKIIHLIRDPRPTIFSQYSRLSYFKKKNLRKYATDFCVRVANDLQEVKHLSTTYPKRVKLLRYETLADDPLHTSEDMYHFLNIPFSEHVRKRVYNMTMSGHRDTGCMVCTTRANSTLTAKTWRERVDVKMATTIDTICADVMATVGYLPIKSPEHFNDTNISLLVKHVKFAGMNI